MPGITKNTDTKKVKQACDECHKRRVKCDYDRLTRTCASCRKLAAQCLFHRVPLKRGPNSGSRKDRHGCLQRGLSTAVQKGTTIHQMPLSPRNSVNGMSPHTSINEMQSRRSSNSSAYSSASSHSSTSSCDSPQTQLYKTLTMLDGVYNAQAGGEWIPLIAMPKSAFVARVTRICNPAVGRLLHASLRLLQRRRGGAGARRVFAALADVPLDTLGGNDTVVALVALTLAQIAAPSRALLGLAVGVLHDTRGRLRDSTDAACARRVAFQLSVLDLLHAETDTRLLPGSVLGCAQRDFAETASPEQLSRLRFFEALREVQCGGATVENVARLRQCVAPGPSLCAQYMRLVLSKYEFVAETAQGAVGHGAMVWRMARLFAEIKAVLARVVREGVQQELFVDAVVAECRRSVGALRPLPAFALQHIVGRQGGGLAALNTKRVSDGEIMQVTQAMNDLVECTGLLGSLGGLPDTVTQDAIVPTYETTAPAPQESAPRSVLDISEMINHEARPAHDSGLPLLVAQRLAN
ncbi:hypothetical protein DAKH74_040010 [Maudiozyma humilis]|uniref:Zn(2)-C6 fungal-type domain-containing protein n=1 Tax=Maudiozyma humilis TaxID=51915 RepID=A0AAV5S0K6_MAUHU|nr:hypothetical protein DAKH74_040010 [Kazachstania humilis]